jgi:hypothetical protein
VDVAARQHAGKLVANELADAQLALRAARGLSMMVMTWHLFTTVASGLGPRISLLLTVNALSGLPVTRR